MSILWQLPLLQQILKSPAVPQRRTKGGWQSVSGLNCVHFLLETLGPFPRTKNIEGAKPRGDRIWYPSHYHILSSPFKSHLLESLKWKQFLCALRMAIGYAGVAYCIGTAWNGSSREISSAPFNLCPGAVQALVFDQVSANLKTHPIVHCSCSPWSAICIRTLLSRSLDLPIFRLSSF